jgi:hypothetical protein
MADGGALRNLRVIDPTDDTGRFASKLLTEAGADVLRVGRGSPGVQMRGQAKEHGGLLDWWYDGGKQRLELDLDSLAGQRQFKDLAARADLLIETEPPGQRSKTRSKRCGNSRLREYQQTRCRTCAIVLNERNTFPAHDLTIQRRAAHNPPMPEAPGSSAQAETRRLAAILSSSG